MFAALASRGGTYRALGFIMALTGTAVALTRSQAIGVAIAAVGVLVVLVAFAWVRLAVAIVRTAASAGALSLSSNEDEVLHRQLLAALQQVGSELQHNLNVLSRVNETGKFGNVGDQRLWLMEWNKASPS